MIPSLASRVMIGCKLEEVPGTGVCTYLGNAPPPLYTYCDGRISGTHESVYRSSPKACSSLVCATIAPVLVPLAIHKPVRAVRRRSEIMEFTLDIQCWVLGWVALIPET